MRVKEPLTLMLPKHVITNIDKYIEASYSSNTDREYICYIVDHLYYQESINRKKDEQFILIKTNDLKSLFKSDKTINYYLKELKENQIIECDKKIIPGKKSFHYKSIALIYDSTTEIKINPEGKLYEAITKRCFLQNKNDNRLAPYLNQMKKKLKSIEFDSEEAIIFVNKNYSGNQLFSALSNINRIKSSKTRFFKRNKTNQSLDTNFTNLKSELRQFIVGDYINIDLKNSQPFLLSRVINRLINLAQPNRDTLCSIKESERVIKVLKNETVKALELIPQLLFESLNEEIKTFMDKCTQGVFYDHFLEFDSFKNLTRDNVKEIMMEVLFSRNHYEKYGKKIIPYKENKNRFKSKYPGIYEIIECLKTKKHSSLAIALQLEESYLFIDVIAKKLCEAGIVPITIHDSLVVEREHEQEALKIISNVFKRAYGIVPKFHVKAL